MCVCIDKTLNNGWKNSRAHARTGGQIYNERDKHTDI